MTSRFSQPVLDPGEYDTLVNEALHAFKTDVMYVIQVAESARSLLFKKSKKLK